MKAELKRFMETTNMRRESNVTVDLCKKDVYGSYQKVLHLFNNVVDAASKVALLQLATTNQYESTDNIGAFIIHSNGVVDVITYDDELAEIYHHTHDVDDEDLYYYFHDEYNSSWIPKCVVAYEVDDGQYMLMTANDMEEN